MLTETGRVLAIDDDGLWVETLQQSTCAQCAAKNGCGQRLLGDLLMPNMTAVKAYFAPGQRRIYRLDEQVEIGIDERALLVTTLTAYMLPLGLMLLGAGLAHHLLGVEWLSVLGALVGLLLGGILVGKHARLHRNNPLYHPQVM